LVRLSGARGYFVQADHSAFDLVGFARRMMEEHPQLSRLYISRGAGNDGAGLEAMAERVSLEDARRCLQAHRIGSRDVLSFQLSGGTTGVPKIIPRFHAEYLGHSTAWMRRFGIGSDDRVIWSLPLLHNAGQLFTLVPGACLGVTVVLMPRVDIARMLELIELHAVTHALSIGPIAPQLIAYRELQRHDLSSLKLFATMSRADVLEAHLGVPCTNMFGITEGLLLGGAPKDSVSARHDTHGASGSRNDEIRLIDPETGQPVPPGEVGELCFKGPSSLMAYYADAVSTAQSLTPDGFFRSGDLMRARLIAGELCYAFEGRMRDNVNRGGEKIGCEEVEMLVSRHPAVADAKLVPMPDAIYGEKGCIFIIPRPGAVCPTVGELAEFLVRLGLAKFKLPERIEQIEDFPVTRVGKLDRTALRRIVCDKLAAEAAQRGEA
jgi:non-ribosomal peptide synthetase component E (peptide arylation enzyme)